MMAHLPMWQNKPGWKDLCLRWVRTLVMWTMTDGWICTLEQAIRILNRLFRTGCSKIFRDGSSQKLPDQPGWATYKRGMALRLRILIMMETRIFISTWVVHIRAMLIIILSM